MFPSHMSIDTATAIFIVEGLHADPTDMCPTASTCHMIASSILHDISLASRARLDVVLCAPLFIRGIPARHVVSVCSAGKAFVELDVAGSADTDETAGAT